MAPKPGAQALLQTSAAEGHAATKYKGSENAVHKVAQQAHHTRIIAQRQLKRAAGFKEGADG
jgi:hypothetical protein